MRGTVSTLLLRRAKLSGVARHSNATPFRGVTRASKPIPNMKPDGVLQKCILLRPGTCCPPSKARLAPIARESFGYPTQVCLSLRRSANDISATPGCCCSQKFYMRAARHIRSAPTYLASRLNDIEQRSFSSTDSLGSCDESRWLFAPETPATFSGNVPWSKQLRYRSHD
jgi:hypothetical protein